MTKFSNNDFLGIYKLQDIDADIRHWSKNITDFSGWYSFWINLRRKVSKKDIDTLDLDLMPGFCKTNFYISSLLFFLLLEDFPQIPFSLIKIHIMTKLDNNYKGKFSKS